MFKRESALDGVILLFVPFCIDADLFWCVIRPKQVVQALAGATECTTERNAVCRHLREAKGLAAGHVNQTLVD